MHSTSRRYINSDAGRFSFCTDHTKLLGVTSSSPTLTIGFCHHPTVLFHSGCTKQFAAPDSYSPNKAFNKSNAPSPLAATPWPHLSPSVRHCAHDARLEGDAAERDCLGEVASILLQ